MEDISKIGNYYYLSIKVFSWKYVFFSRFFAEMWKKENVLYHTAMKDIKKEHFHSMNYHKSHDSELRNKGLIKILEIGAGTG